MEDVPDESIPLHNLKFYVDEFRQIQESVKAHLTGISCDEPPLLPAFLPPSSYWTSAEKDLFFHGLSVYSRLQPELIAQHVKTKSTFDVCIYLEVLKRATEVVQEGDGDGTDNSLRGEVEYAMEVSEKWVQREEAISETLMALDACSCSLEGPNSKLVEKCTCLSTSDGDSESQEVTDYPVPPKCHNNNLNHLDPTCLTVLEMIRRKGENENYPDDAQSLGEERQRSKSVLDRQGRYISSPRCIHRFTLLQEAYRLKTTLHLNLLMLLQTSTRKCQCQVPGIHHQDPTRHNFVGFKSDYTCGVDEPRP